MKLWDNISNLGVKPFMEDADIRRAKLTNRLIVIAFLMGFTYIPLFINEGSTPLLIQIGVLLISIASLFFAVRKSKHEVAAVLLSFLLITHLLIAGILIEGGTGKYFLFLFSILGFAMVKPIKWGVFIFTYAIFAFFTAEITHPYIEPLIVRTPEQTQVVYVINMLLIFMGSFFLIFHYKSGNLRYEKNILSQKRQIESQHSKLVESHDEIQDSIRYAKRIQSAILPPDSLVSETLTDAFVLYKPKDVVAGDFYWLEPVPGTHKSVMFAAADCTGHGVPGAMVSVICNNSLNRAVREFKLTDPGQILDKSREIVIKEFEKSEEEVKDGMDIALCFLETDSSDGSIRLKYAGAHNPLWLIRNHELIEYKADKQPIGRFDNIQPFKTHSIDLKKGDCIYVFSDGFADQFGGEKGKKFKTPNLKKLLLEIHGKPMKEQKFVLERTFEEWRGEIEQLDDICFIGVRI
ncbi:MAG: SpoIIE family protein phosphatase [Crocinitomicaceae bacterium]|nr:SpoIIE family protein phosphatase [Crocinitomicaceae bacterium]